jgi:ribosome-associated protein
VIPVTDHISLEDDELDFSFIRASGPGGQNVNKVATAVQMRFDARRSKSLSDGVSIRLQRIAGSKLTQDGVIVITANRFRTQERNRADALERLAEMIRAAEPAPVKRRATKPTYASKLRRLEGKTRRSGVKAGRSRPDAHD